MDNKKLGSTSLERIPKDFLNPKRKTNRMLTLVIIILVTIPAVLFLKYRQTRIQQQSQEVVPVSSVQTTPSSMGELEQSLNDTEIPSFHETL